MSGVSVIKQVVAVLAWPFRQVAGWVAPIPRVVKMLTATVLVSGGVAVSALMVPSLSAPVDALMQTIERRAYHTCFYWRDTLPARPEIVIVGIDDESCEYIGTWPWPRTFHARVVRNLHEAGAKVIAFDVVFSEESPVEATELAMDMLGSVQELMAEGRYGEAAELVDTHMDDLMAIALGSVGSRADQDFAQACREAGNVILGAHAPITGSQRMLEEVTQVDRSSIELPIAALEEAAFMSAMVDIEPNVLGGADEVYAYMARKELELSPETGEPVRRMVTYPGLAAASVGAYLGLTPEETRAQIKQGTLGGHDIVTTWRPKDWDEETGEVQMFGASMLVHFAGPPERTFTYVPYYQIHDGDRAAACRGKIVMIGATTQLLRDHWPTPYFRQSPMPGVEVQANAVQTMLDGSYIKRAPGWAEMAALFGSCLVLALLTLWLRPVRTLGFVVLTWVGLFYLELYLFRDHRMWLRAITPLVAATVSFVAVSTLVYFTEEREKRQLRNVFQRYVGSNVMNEIMERHGVELGGEARTVTMIFSDLQGFTTLSQDLSAQDVVALLRPYLTAMTNIVFSYQGTLDKFMGDGIMAYFGAPVHFEDHAEKAVLAAIDMQERLARMRQDGRLRVPLHMRIGVHTGEAVVGDVGSDTVSDYTVIGDPVNVSSRLEELNKEYGSEILISDETYRRVEGLVEAEYLGEEVVRGRDRPTGVYKVLGRKGGVRREDFMV